MKACAGELRTARGLMDATPLSLRLDNAVRRPELGPLLAMVAMLLDTQPTLVLHITAARHGEGTTTLARDLAAAAARARWRQVALIDAGHNTDSAALPTLLDPFERGRPASLAAGWLAGETVALGRLAAGWLAGETVALGRLAAPGDPAPRIESLRGLLAGLRAQYGVIILDAPPVLAAREAAVLARLADGVLLVLAAERTKLADARQARAILEQLGATILGVVLNRRRARLPGLVDRLTK